MVITKLVVTDEKGVEHVVEGKGWFRIRSQNYTRTKDTPPKPAPTELHAEAHITLTGDGLEQVNGIPAT